MSSLPFKINKLYKCMAGVSFVYKGDETRVDELEPGDSFLCLGVKERRHSDAWNVRILGLNRELLGYFVYASFLWMNEEPFLEITEENGLSV